MRRARRGVVYALTLALAGVASGAAASTGDVVIASGLASPSGLAVGSDGSVYVSQLLPGALLEVSAGTGTVVGQSPDPVTAVDVSGRGVVVFTTSGAGATGSLERLLPDGRTLRLADLGQFEAERNPDAVNSYGFQDLDPDCGAGIESSVAFPGGGAPYSGGVASTAAAVAVLPDGSRVVADRGGNDLLLIERGSAASTLAVLPPVPVVVTPAIAASHGLPGCAIGATYHLEPRPTDVETGPDGRLYVSSMPTGLSLGRGSIVVVDPETGAIEELADGFRGAIDLAVGDDGTVYVAEQFGGQISIANGDSPITFRMVERPSAVEFVGDALHAAVGFSFGPPTGEVVTFFLR